MNQKQLRGVWRIRTLVYVIGVCFAPLFAQGVTLEWDRNPETNVRGYRVYTGRQSRVYDTVLDVSNRTLVEFSATPGKVFFAVTAYDTDDLESDFSDEVSYTAPRTNAMPTAQPDEYVATSSRPLNVSPASGVLANDTDPDDDRLTADLLVSVTHGTLVFGANGSFVYTPAEGFTGIDSFAYSSHDGSMSSAVTMVTIIVPEAPNPQDCSTCFAAVDAILTLRSNAFRPVIEARRSVATDVICPQFGVAVFGAVSRSVRTMNDVAMNEALGFAAECLVSNIKSDLAARLAMAAGLSPSSWTGGASNHLNAAWRKLDRILTLSNSMSQFPLLAASAASLSRADRFIVSGDLAPVSLANRTLACSIVQQGQTSPLTFVFSQDLFVVQDADGTPLSMGQYTFTRTAWNKGSLMLTFDGPLLGYEAGGTTTVQIKFSRTRSRLTGSTFRGYFTMH